MKGKPGHYKFCERDTLVYDQRKGGHGDECHFCWNVYSRLKGHPALKKIGIDYRDAQRRILSAPAASHSSVSHPTLCSACDRVFVAIEIHDCDRIRRSAFARLLNGFSHSVSSKLNGATAKDVQGVIAAKSIDETTKLALINARLGQGKFRDQVLALWNNRCALSGIGVLEAVRSSHIKPWRDSTNEERLDPYNGLPLVANLDALFDAGLITFEDGGYVVVSDALPEAERKQLGVSSKAKLARKLDPRTTEYLKHHRTEVFRRQ